MSMWNYAVTAHKSTSVLHSCVGNFTGAKDRNLIIARRSHIEIHLLTSHGLQLMLDVPIHGRIATLELCRPQGESQDLIFVCTEKYRYCLLEWNGEIGRVSTRSMGDVSNTTGRPTKRGQSATIDPDGRMIGLHLYDELFTVIPFDNNGQLEEPYHVRLAVQVLDIKFLYGCPLPTIAVLSKEEYSRTIKPYIISLEQKDIEQGSYMMGFIGNGADLLIPVPPPLCGILVIGKDAINYGSIDDGSIDVDVVERIPPCITRAYARVDEDGTRYLLGDQNGVLRLLTITLEKDEDPELSTKCLGDTSIASTLSYLGNSQVYVGSTCGNSQLINLKLEAEAKGPFMEVVDTYVNLGPIVDFCVVDLERYGQGQVVTCSGAYKDGSLRVVRNGVKINEQVSLECPIITGMWSLRSATGDMHHTHLVLSFINATRIMAMNHGDKLEETQLEGFSYNMQSLFCHNAVHNQLVQITSNSVRLVSSTGGLRSEWSAPSSINVATANASQVLLAVGRGRLIYLKIGDGKFSEVEQAELKDDISCLDLNPIGQHPNHSLLAAVGMWTDSVRIYSLPGLDLLREEHLGDKSIPRSVLLCSFEGVPYLLCGLGDGHLLNFVLNMNTGELIKKKKVSLGTQHITVHSFSWKNSMHVFAASDRPTVIYSSNKKLLYSSIYMEEVNHMCPFNFAAFPDGLAIATESELKIDTIDDIHKLLTDTIPLQAHVRAICHQKQTGTFALCCIKHNHCSTDDSEVHTICLLNDQTFKVISTFRLDQYEYACSIVSCSFSDDTNVYYCVGTAFVKPEYEAHKGRILVLLVEDGNLHLVFEKEFKGPIYSLNAFNGNLLVAMNQKIQLYKWMLRNNGTRKLQSVCRHHGHLLPLYVQTFGNFILVGDMVKSLCLLVYKDKEGAIEELARDSEETFMSAVEILDDNIYLGADCNYNLVTLRKEIFEGQKEEKLWKKSKGLMNEEGNRLQVVGKYHLGEFVNRFRHGSLVMHLPDSDSSQIPTVIFGTVDGGIGVIASLPHDLYIQLEKLQSELRRVIPAVGAFRHDEWRSFYNGRETVDATNFLDGDMIESFLDLRWVEKEEVSRSVGDSVEVLIKRVERLRTLH